MRTMKNSSRLRQTIERKRSRSRRGTPGSSASASTRASNSIQLKSRLMKCSGTDRHGSSASSGNGTALRSSSDRRAREAGSELTTGVRLGGPPVASSTVHSGMRSERAATVSAARVRVSFNTGDPTQFTSSPGVIHTMFSSSSGVGSRLKSRASHTSRAGRVSVAGTGPSNRNRPSALPKALRIAWRQVTSPCPS